jgi:hypothetical protein
MITGRTPRINIGRRRLLVTTATGIAATALGAAAGSLWRPAQAATGTVRWVSPRGTIEVLDDYPYWVAKKFGYFGDIETTLDAGPIDATANVKLVDQEQADMGYPSPGVFSLALEQEIPLTSVWEMGAYDVFDFAFRKGQAVKSLAELQGKTVVLGSPGWSAICAPMFAQAGVDPTTIKYADAGNTWGRPCNKGRAMRRSAGRACAPIGPVRGSTSTTLSVAISRSFRRTRSSSAAGTSRMPRRRTCMSPICAAGRWVWSSATAIRARRRTSSCSSSPISS